MLHSSPDDPHSLTVQTFLTRGEKMAENTALSTRQAQCLIASRYGCTNEEIATALDISQHTVRNNIRDAKRNLESIRNACAEFICPKYATVHTQSTGQFLANHVWRHDPEASRVAQFIGFTESDDHQEHDYDTHTQTIGEAYILADGMFADIVFIVRGSSVNRVVSIEGQNFIDYICDWLFTHDAGKSHLRIDGIDAWGLTHMFRDDFKSTLARRGYTSLDLFADDRFRDPREMSAVVPARDAMDSRGPLPYRAKYIPSDADRQYLHESEQMDEPAIDQMLDAADEMHDRVGETAQPFAFHTDQRYSPPTDE